RAGARVTSDRGLARGRAAADHVHRDRVLFVVLVGEGQVEVACAVAGDIDDCEGVDEVVRPAMLADVVDVVVELRCDDLRGTGANRRIFRVVGDVMAVVLAAVDVLDHRIDGGADDVAGDRAGALGRAVDVAVVVEGGRDDAGGVVVHPAGTLTTGAVGKAG